MKLVESLSDLRKEFLDFPRPSWEKRQKLKRIRLHKDIVIEQFSSLGSMLLFQENGDFGFIGEPPCNRWWFKPPEERNTFEIEVSKSLDTTFPVFNDKNLFIWVHDKFSSVNGTFLSKVISNYTLSNKNANLATLRLLATFSSQTLIDHEKVEEVFEQMAKRPSVQDILDAGPDWVLAKFFLYGGLKAAEALSWEDDESLARAAEHIFRKWRESQILLP